MGYHGIDVSEYQGVIDWASIQKEFTFAMLRAGYGVTEKQIDKKFELNIDAAFRNGFNIGCYWFLYALTVEDAIKNAEAFLKVLEPHRKKITFPVVLDVEGDTVRYMKMQGVEPSKYLISEMIKAFCDRMEKAGFYVMVYSDNSFINTYFKNEILEKYDLWFAYWVNVFNPSYCTRHCGMWQHTNNGNVEGIEGRVDLDYTEKDYFKIISELEKKKEEVIVPVSSVLIESGTVTETDTQIHIILNKKVK